MELEKRKQEKITTTATQFSEQRKYWLEKLSGELPRTCFPDNNITAGAVKKNSPGGYHSCGFELPGTTTAIMQKLSGSSDPKWFMILTAGVIGLLNKYTSNRDILVGTPIYRQATPGSYLNTVLTLRNRVNPARSFKNLLIQVRQTVIKANKNQNYPIERLVYDLKLPEPTDHFSLWDIAVLLENIHDPTYIEAVPWGVIFSFCREENQVKGKITYRSSRYTGETMKRIAGHYRNFLEEALSHIDTPLSAIEILAPREKEQLLHGFNTAASDYPGDKSLDRLLEEQVYRIPDNTAVVSSPQSTERKTNNGEGHHAPCAIPGALTYRELHEKSQRLAQVLQQKGVKPDIVVGLMVDPSIELVAGIWGILKAGGAYLPIDPAYPEERIDYMIKDCGTKILVTHDEMKDWLFTSTTTSTLTTLSQVNPANLAYVIYTSGSTGKPKGAAVEHRNILNYTWWRIKKYRQTERDITMQPISVSFDGFCANFYPTLLTGGKLVMLNRDSWNDFGSIRDLIRKEIVTNFSVVPSWYRLLIEGGSKEDFPGLRFVVLAGEKPRKDIIAASQQLLPGVTLINEYGPTENSVTTTAYIGMTQETGHVIGKPIANTAVYILGEELELKPPGVPGELCISAAGLARGYLNRLRLTAENFVTSPIVARERIYRTGDLAAWLPDGNLEFLGRIDHQLNVRGLRIEPGEIESHLQKLEGINEVVVTVKEDEKGDERLCAYMVSEKEFKNSELREYLSRELVDYMIPSFFIRLQQLPITLNGKIDRQSLPAPEVKANEEYEAPKSDPEKILAKIWQEVLGVEGIGINNNFFDLGGDSIKVIQISARLRRYGLNLEIMDVFTNPTIKQVAKLVKKIDRVIDQGEIEGEVELIPIQRWFLENNSININPFNQSVILFNKERFNEKILSKVFTRIITHHDTLRMVYYKEENKVVQRNRGLEGKLFDLEVAEIHENQNIEEEIEKESNRIQRGINLKEGPIVKLGLFKTAHGHYLLIAVHHFVVDGLSWRILLEDLALGIHQAERGEEITFQEKTDSFKYWADKLCQYSESGDLLKEIEYWKNIEEIEIKSLPRDHRIGIEKKITKNMEAVFINLDEMNTEKMLREVNRTYNTEIKDILLTALGLAIKEWAGIEKISINFEGHGREPIIEGVNISRTIGWFTAQYPFIIDMSQTGDLSYTIKSVKEALRKVPNNGIGYGLLRYLTPVEKKKGLKLEKDPEVAFNYMGQYGQESTNTTSELIFEFSNIKSGISISTEFKRKSAIEVTGTLMGKYLDISFNYNKYEYEKKNIKKLADLYKSNLIKIIGHCVSQEERESTPSDLVADDVEISLEALDEIKEFTNLNIEE